MEWLSLEKVYREEIIMKEISRRDTEILLTVLNSEINNKCIEIKAEKYQEKLKNIFFISCGLFLLIIITQVILRLFNASYIMGFLLYQSIIMIVIVPLLFRAMKGAILK